MPKPDDDQREGIDPSFTCALLSQPRPRNVLAPAQAKPLLFRERYDVLRQRLLRNELFRADSAFHNPNNLEDEANFFKVRTVKMFFDVENRA